MKVIALLPVKNEAWVLEHTLASLSGFCDVILINDQQSTDGTREIAARFPKAVWIESAESQICEQARWRLWDVARDYDGTNLLWCTDADELVSPRLARRFLDDTQDGADRRRRDRFPLLPLLEQPGALPHRVSAGRTRPYLKPVAIVDDRRADYDRSRALPLHEERVPIAAGARRLKAEHVPVLHLQWLLPNRSQMRQAWYRCREWMQGGRTAAAINEQYAHTLPERYVPTAPVPHEWIDDVTLPGTAVDAEPSWHEADILRWFDERGVAFFEPIEIWAGAPAAAEFRRAGRAGVHSPIVRTCRPGSSGRGSSGGACWARRSGESSREPAFAHGAHPADPAGAAARLSVTPRRGPFRLEARRARPRSLTLSRALRAGAKRRRGTASDRRRLQLQPAHVQRSRARRVRARQRGAAAGDRAEAAGNRELRGGGARERAVRGRERRHPAGPGDRSRHRAVRVDGRFLRGISGARREEPGVSVRGGCGGVEAGGPGESKPKNAARWSTGRAATNVSAKPSRRS